MGPSSAAWSILLVSIWLLLRPAQCSQVAAWYHEAFGDAAQVVSFDGDTQALSYSLCDGSNPPVFPNNRSATFDLSWAPFVNTNIAAVGYAVNGTKYLAGEVFQCEDSGYYSARGYPSWRITSDFDAPIQKGTGLAVLVLPGDDDDEGGFRVYFKDDYSHTVAVRYLPSEEDWKYDGYISQDQNMAFSVAAGFASNDNITVLNPRNDNVAIEVMTLQGDTWDIDTFPVPLESSNATNETSSGTSFEYDEASLEDYETLEAFESLKARASVVFLSNGTRSIFYVGSDRDLHRIQEGGGEQAGTWAQATPEDRAYWPLADTANANYGYAFDAASDRIWIFYSSNGSMAQVHQSSLDVWETAVALPSGLSSSGSGSGSGDNTTTTTTNRDGPIESGLGAGTRMGIGLGIGVGAAIVLVLAGAAFWVYRRRHSRSAQKQQQPEGPDTGEGDSSKIVYTGSPVGPPGAYGGGGVVYEMSDDGQRYEMSNQGQRHELSADRRVSELPGTQAQK
ncbi:hypothetical protein SLS62_002813 [Diatrype stigma]|uniref:Uncharacterized protein n=1 Tax=Diatrype stigma TaxID=117547 RepID=A0AAN9UWS4_9PEZI